MVMRIIIALLVAAAGAWTAITYPMIGDVLYRTTMATEAFVYGFDKKRKRLGELDVVYFEAENTDKPVILMLHGYSADKTVWLRFARHFTDEFRVVIPDMAGHGETEFNSAWDFSVEAQSKRLVDLLDAMNIDAVHIIGNSMGGFISADFALRFTERTRTVALVDPAGVASPVPSEMEKMLAAGRNPFLVNNREQFSEFFSMTMAKPPWLPGVVLDAMAQDYQQRKPQLDKIYEDLQRSASLEDRLSQLNKPTLLLWGREDKLIHVSSVDVWRANVPQIEVTIWDGIGHMPMLEIAGESAERYRQFLIEQTP